MKKRRKNMRRIIYQNKLKEKLKSEKKDNSDIKKYFVRQFIGVLIVKILVILGLFLRLMLFLIGFADFELGFDQNIINSWKVFWLVSLPLFGMIFLIYLFFDWKNRYYLIDDKGITYVQGVLWKRRLIVRFPSVDKILYKKGVFGLIFGFGTIRLRSSETNQEIALKFVPNPKKYLEIIKDKLPGAEMF